MEEPIRKVVIIGGGTAGWMTAAALIQHVKAAPIQVTLVESDAIGTVGVGEATVPTIQQFIRMLKIDERDFMRRCDATFKNGIEFRGWGGEHESYFHPFGRHGIDDFGIDFSQYWLRWKAEGGTLPFSDFSVASKASQSGKFQHTSNGQDRVPLPPLIYAYHFDASKFATFIREFSEAAGVRRVEGIVREVGRDPVSANISHVTLDDGRVVEGDFFVDCTGFRGLLINDTLGSDFEDWSKYLPMNRAVAAQTNNVTGDFPPYTTSTVRNAGWQWKIPLQSRNGNGYVYCSDYISEDAAQEEFLKNLDSAPITTPKTLRFTTGARRDQWKQNCVSIGLSAGFLEPLESTSIQLIQLGIIQLIRLFPLSKKFDQAAIKFNEVMYSSFVQLRDFLILHYKLSKRDHSEFWRWCQNMDLPDSYIQRFELMKESGQPHIEILEPFLDQSWFAVALGQGMEFPNYHPFAGSYASNELDARVRKFAADVRQRVDQMPSHSEYLKWYLS